jgi:CO dehydrogenase/acetyl-CoA synthase alpha subunit
MWIPQEFAAEVSAVVHVESATRFVYVIFTEVPLKASTTEVADTVPAYVPE